MKGTTLALALACLAAGTLRADDKDTVLKLFQQHPCTPAFLMLEKGQAYEWKLLRSEGGGEASFALLRSGARVAAIEFAEKNGGVTVVDQRAWMTRNGNKRVVTETNGALPCESKNGLYGYEKLENALKEATLGGRWNKASWKPAPAPKPAPAAKAGSKKAGKKKG